MTNTRARPKPTTAPGSDSNCRVCAAKGTARPFMDLEAISYLRCDRCMATYVALKHLPDPDAELNHYLSHENDPFEEGYRKFLSKLSTPLLKRLLNPSSGLDYGCGPGPALAHMMSEAGHQMRLYDPFFSPEFPQTSNDPAIAPKNPLDACYDFITCTETAEHFHFPAREFAKLDTLLRPGGWLGVMTCFQGDDARFKNWHYRKDPTHVVFYRAQTFKNLAQDFGWKCHVVAKDVALMQKPKASQNAGEIY